MEKINLDIERPELNNNMLGVHIASLSKKLNESIEEINKLRKEVNNFKKTNELQRRTKKA